MKKRIFISIALGCLTVFVSFSLMNKEETRIKQNNCNPKDGYVPDEVTAIKVAEAIWLPIYGKGIYKEKPFHAKLINDSIWVVEGTLHEELGGVVRAEIQKQDCKVLKIIHNK